jgi:hypothetical protein
MLIEKYQRQLEEHQKYRVTRGIKQDRFFEAQNRLDQQGPRRPGEPLRRMVRHSTNQEPRVRQNPQFVNRLGSGNPDHRVNHPDVLHDEGGSS